MTFHKTKRAAICAVAASWLVLCIAGPSAVQAEDSKADATGGEGASKLSGSTASDYQRSTSFTSWITATPRRREIRSTRKKTSVGSRSRTKGS